MQYLRDMSQWPVQPLRFDAVCRDPPIRRYFVDILLPARGVLLQAPAAHIATRRGFGRAIEHCRTLLQPRWQSSRKIGRGVWCGSYWPSLQCSSAGIRRFEGGNCRCRRRKVGICSYLWRTPDVQNAGWIPGTQCEAAGCQISAYCRF